MKFLNLKNTVGNIFTKKNVLLFVVVFSFFYFQTEIIYSINKHLTTDADFSNSILDLGIISVSVLITFYLLYKMASYSYQPSFNQKVVIGMTVFLILYYKLINIELPWTNLSDSFFNIEYNTYVLVPLIVALMFFVIIKFYKKLDTVFSLKNDLTKNNSNVYLNDDPILNEDEDILNYQPKIDSLKSILLNETYKKSISIGLVGPWGNGKSSVIHMTQLQIENQTKDDILMIHFLPYLNHKEDDIINEFFISLSKQLSKYSGKLSSQILDYSKKLTEVYKGGNVFDFFDKHVSNINSTPAKELYDDINTRLQEIDKKIIIFVDDLDRLSGKEIIQVLKLIRNTANFTNTIFVVAMDKDYVINRLKSENNISSTRFVDKFFQLEIYLPEIDKTILRNFVSKSLKDSILNNSSDFEINFSRGFNHKGNLFDDFIKNLRDSKRLVNQIIFDYTFLGEEINFKDFLNFTYFKLKFPKFMELLSHNKLDFLILKNGEYGLKPKPEPEGENTPVIQSNYRDLFIFNSIKSNDYSYLKKYAVTDLLLPSSDCLRNVLNIDCDDVLLLSKSLAHLFGEENKVEDFNSIKKENNFNMLMQQRVFKELFLENEFQQLIKEEDEEKRHNIIESLYSQNKLIQLFSRLDYFSSNDEKLMSNIILIIFKLYEKRREYEVQEQQLLNKMGVFVDRYIDKDEGINQENVDWVQKQLFKGSILSSENKLSIICELFDSKIDNKLWHIKEDELTNKALLLFKGFLESKKDKLWAVNDYSIYKYYHSLKFMRELKEKLNKEIKDFWRGNNIELLCVQSTDSPGFSLSSFKISDGVKDVFGSRSQFHEFILKHSENPSDAVKEFIDLYNLHEITGYSLPVIYQFSSSKLMIKKIEVNGANQKRSKYDEDANRLQIVFETNLEGLFLTLIDIRRQKGIYDLVKEQYPKIKILPDELEASQFLTFSFRKKTYLFVSYDKKHRTSHAIEILKTLEAITNVMYHPKNNNFEPYKTKLSSKENIIVDQDHYMKVLSIQP
ncbi:P-loop NTPase fold protein [Olleya sp. Hel_I_94]|uniref:KAP family P-loop NTPase fold protein n=1 Tax=Olleya sp. Hel_I_94 TaxID=1250001 RepID=UPI00119D53F5|nr:P-loop NTPase fold protein [Olleya sp. Hel_I_94]TVZ46150.1 KAP-like P-loop domain-containing protein [Olleya sp. Hel_I_94]